MAETMNFSNQFSASDLFYVKNTRLDAVLDTFEYLETNDEFDQRMDVLNKLDWTVKQWVQKTSISKGISEEVATQNGGRIYVVGSHRLGVATRDADLDILCVVPSHITSEDFFTSFADLLKNQPDITHFRIIKDAHVPIIRMIFYNIEVDISCAILNSTVIPEDIDFKEDKILEGLDPVSVQSLNALRVADKILELVPNHEAFQLTLLTIKLWAKRRGVYSSMPGYCGGLTWAILLANVCINNPDMEPAALLLAFFQLYSLRNSWNSYISITEKSDVNMSFQVWNPNDKELSMKVITPTYPEENTTQNVCTATRSIMMYEFQRAAYMLPAIMTKNGQWEIFLEKQPFFTRYEHFVVVTVKANTRSDFIEWGDFVESKIHLLIAKLSENDCLQVVHANPNKLSSLDSDQTDGHTDMWYIGLEIVTGKNIDELHLEMDINNFIRYVEDSFDGINEGMILDGELVYQKCDNDDNDTAEMDLEDFGKYWKTFSRSGLPKNRKNKRLTGRLLGRNKRTGRNNQRNKFKRSMKKNVNNKGLHASNNNSNQMLKTN